MIKIIHGEVIKGKQLGRKIGFPTANLLYNKNDIEDATYKINIIVDGILYNGAGVYRKNLKLFEAHILNFDKDIYGKNIEIIILEKIRDNIKINSLDELKILIESDIIKINNIKNTVLTFGTFDTIHKGHIHFLNQAKKYGDKLITILATDKNVKKIKGKKTLYNLEQRVSDLNNFNISDKIIGGDETNHLKWLDIYSPKVICLGYDQIGFSKGLNEYIKSNNLKIEVIRLKPFMEKKYKSSIIKNQL